MLNPLDATALATYMIKSLPTGSSPQLKSPFEAIALAVHAGMLAVGYRLKGLGEDHQFATSADSQLQVLPLPKEWNASTSYAFRYAHSQSAMEYLVKVNRLGSKAVVFGIGLGDDKTTSFDVTVSDYISESSFPADPVPSANEEKAEQEGSDEEQAKHEDVIRNIQNIFISPARLTDFGSLLRLKIIHKLTPGLQKEGYEESSSEQRSGDTRAANTNPSSLNPTQQPPYNPTHPYADTLADHTAHNRRPFPSGEFSPPGFDDELDILRPPRGIGDRPPFTIGDADLYPPGLGPQDPFRGTIGGGLPRPGGGMYPTFDDPIFAGRGGGIPGQDYDPAAPPGARWDPIGPGMGGGPRDGRGRGGFPHGPGAGFGGGSRPPNPFSGFGDGDFM